VPRLLEVAAGDDDVESKPRDIVRDVHANEALPSLASVARIQATNGARVGMDDAAALIPIAGSSASVMVTRAFVCSRDVSGSPEL